MMAKKQALWILASLVVSITKVAAVEPNPEVFVVEDDGADESEETNFKDEATVITKHHEVHDEGDDHDDDPLDAHRAMNSQKPMDDDKHSFVQMNTQGQSMKPSHTEVLSFALGEDLFAEYKNMTEEEFAEMAERETRPLMEGLMAMVDEHTRQLHEAAEKDPALKWYMDLFGDPYYHEYGKRMKEKKVPSEPEEPSSQLQGIPEVGALELDDEEKPDKKEVSLLEKVRAKNNASKLEKVKKRQYKREDDEEVQEEGQYHPVDRKLLKEQTDKESIVKEAGADPDAAQKAIDNLFKKVADEVDKTKVDKEYEEPIRVEEVPVDEEGDALPENSAARMHVDMEDDSDEENHEEGKVVPRSAKNAHKTKTTKTIRHHKKSETKKQIRSASVDAAGNIIDAAVADPQVRSASGAEDDAYIAATPASTDSNGGEAKPQKSTDASSKDELAIAKKTQYVSMAGVALAVVVVAWLLVRRRAQQLIDRAEAFDDASSVSSSTMTEENPTVKVNRALLERMATISQKLSEKVEEARTSDSNSSNEYGRQYRREKKNPQDS